MTDAEVESKFADLCRDAISLEAQSRIREVVWELDSVAAVDRLTRALATA